MKRFNLFWARILSPEGKILNIASVRIVVVQFVISTMNSIGAGILTNTILGGPCYTYSIMGPKTLFYPVRPLKTLIVTLIDL